MITFKLRACAITHSFLDPRSGNSRNQLRDCIRRLKLDSVGITAKQAPALRDISTKSTVARLT